MRRQYFQANKMLKIVQRDVGLHLLYWLESSPEEIHVELLELGPGQSLGEVLALEQGLNLHANLINRHLVEISTLEVREVED